MAFGLTGQRRAAFAGRLLYGLCTTHLNRYNCPLRSALSRGFQTVASHCSQHSTEHDDGPDTGDQGQEDISRPPGDDSDYTPSKPFWGAAGSQFRPENGNDNRARQHLQGGLDTVVDSETC